MIIEKLIIENFASFFGRHEISLVNSPEKPLTIIIGGGAFGKTSIFDAINWSLYGRLYEPELYTRSERKIEDFINETALRNARSEKQSVEMQCTLFFEHDEKKYRIQQELVAIPNKVNEKINATDRSTSLYEIHLSGNSTPINYSESFLNEILPSNVRDYFLFNGERIEKLAMPGASNEIRDGIYRVIDLELFQNGSIHLSEIANKFRKRAKAESSGEVANIEQRYSDAQERLSLLKGQHQNLLGEKRAAEDQIEIIGDKLRGLQKTIDLQKARDRLEQQIKILEEEFKKIAIELRELSSIAGLCFAIDPIVNLEKKLDEKRDKGEIPSEISENLLHDILEMKRCICGTKFQEKDEIFRTLEQRLLQEKNKKNKGNDLIDLFFGLKAAQKDIENALDNLNKLDKDRNLNYEKQKELDKELKEIVGKLSKIPDENISKLTNKYEEINNSFSEIKVNISHIITVITETEKRIEDLKIDRERLGKQQDLVRRYQLRDDLAQNAASELDRIFSIFAEDTRKEVENLTKNEFARFMPTASSLTVSINPEFHYEIRDQDGNSVLQQLSMGQKQALSLAFITSISRVSEKYPPLVIDMPFGRLDKDVQRNIASRLPLLSSQIILLVLPGTEWNEITQLELHKYASNIYRLEFNKKARETTIFKEL